MRKPYETDIELTQYLRSLVPTGKSWRVIAEDSGATLYMVGADHVVMVECIEHDHDGWKRLLRCLPHGWGEFAAFENRGDWFRAHHFGPPWSTPEAALAILPGPPPQR